MNKKLLCVLMALIMVLSAAACGKKTETPAGENSAAQGAPSAEARELSLTDWSFSVDTWSSPNGATVNLTAVPTEHAKKDSAVFVVRLEGEEITSVPCEWKDNAYVASADLNAADGYSYYVILAGEDGASAEIAVNTPAEPVDEALVNMASSLESFCSLTLDDTSLSEDSLTILGGYALVQAPRITENGETVACAQATLVLTLDGQEVSSTALTMAPGEADRSYDAVLTDMSFAVPETIAEGQQLVLRLDAVLTNGQTLTSQGGNWYYTEGSLTNAVG